MRSVFDWNIGSRVLPLGKRTLVMGILNVTPDSFSDGGQFLNPEKALEHGLRLLDEGADIIDVGGESTRPGARVASPAKGSESAKPLGEAEECERILPVIARLKRKRPAAVISVDTYKAGVARAAIEAGAEIVNDVSAFRWDPKMAKTVAELKCGAVLMHMRGRPEEWRELPPVADVVVLVKRELRDWADAATMAGVKRERMVLDPVSSAREFACRGPAPRRVNSARRAVLMTAAQVGKTWSPLSIDNQGFRRTNHYFAALFEDGALTFPSTQEPACSE